MRRSKPYMTGTIDLLLFPDVEEEEVPT